MVPVPLTVEPIIKNASNICLIRLVRLKAYITSRTLAAFICCKNWTNHIFRDCFLRESDSCVCLGSFNSRRGKENQLMSEVRTVERNMIPHRAIVSSTVYFGRRSKKTPKLCVTGVFVGVHKGPVTWKMFPFDDVIMEFRWALACRYPTSLYGSQNMANMTIWHRSLQYWQNA